MQHDFAQFHISLLLVAKRRDVLRELAAHLKRLSGAHAER
jgi:hypothetical protein